MEGNPFGRDRALQLIRMAAEPGGNQERHLHVLPRGVNGRWRVARVDSLNRRKAFRDRLAVARFVDGEADLATADEVPQAPALVTRHRVDEVIVVLCFPYPGSDRAGVDGWAAPGH